MAHHRFQFWRVLVALAHADHTVAEEERDFIVSKFDYIDFSEAEKAQLLNELENPQNPSVLFREIDSAEDRAECLYMAHNLMHADGDFSTFEQKFYDDLKADHMSSFDQEAIKADLRTLMAQQKAKREQDNIDIEKYRDENDFLSLWYKWFKK